MNDKLDRLIVIYHDELTRHIHLSLDPLVAPSLLRISQDGIDIAFKQVLEEVCKKQNTPS